MNPSLRRWVVPSFTGSYPPLLGQTLRCWVVPSVVGSLPPSLGQTLRRWAKPSFCASSLHLHSASSLPLVVPRPLVILPSSYAVVVALRSYLRRHLHTDASALGSSHLHLCVFRHISVGFDPRTFVSFYASALGSILTPSRLLTHRRWDPYTFASFDTSALGSLHLRVFRHVGVGFSSLCVFPVESGRGMPTSLARGEEQPTGLSVVVGSGCCGRGVFQVPGCHGIASLWSGSCHVSGKFLRWRWGYRR